MRSGISRSGVRIRGDDYHHLFAWIQVIHAILGHSEIVALGVEDPEAGNADDVTLYKKNGECEYFQAKGSVDGREPVSTEWLMKASRAGGPSMIQGFYKLWASASSDCKPKITLVTNRLPTNGDSILSMRDGRNGTVVRGLKQASAKSRAGVARKMLSEHLDITEDETVTFFANIHFIFGRLDEEWKQDAKSLMYAAGLCFDEDSVRKGIDIVHEWVTEGTRKLTIHELHEAVKPLKRLDDIPASSLLIQAIDRDPMPHSATVVLDWTDQFPGEDPEARLLPLDQALWNDKFRPELKNAARSLKAQRKTNILVQGHMRLPTWFATGVELRKTAGFQVTSFQGEEPWSSTGPHTDFPVQVCNVELSDGNDLAVGIALAYDLSAEVLTYVRESVTEAGRFVCIRPEKGPSNQAIHSHAEARSWAFCVRDKVRKLVQDGGHSKVHLFLAGPSGTVLLLGHLWDRMPPTHLYEYLGPTRGYSPSFVVPL